MNDRSLTAAELGALFRLTAGTILDRFEAGDFLGFRLFPKTDRRGRHTGPVRFRLSEIEAALEVWRVGGRRRDGRRLRGILAHAKGTVAVASPALTRCGRYWRSSDACSAAQSWWRRWLVRKRRHPSGEREIRS